MSQTSDGVGNVVIELFMREDSEQCRRIAAYLKVLQASRTGVDVKSYDVIADRSALARLWQLSRDYHYEKAGVPAVYLADNLLMGFHRETPERIESLLRIRAYVRPGCRHCADAKRFLDQLATRWPALRIEYHDVVNDPAARSEALQLARKHHARAVSFPCIEVAGRLIIGYQGDEITGRQLESYFLPAGPDSHLPSPQSTRLSPESGANMRHADAADDAALHVCRASTTRASMFAWPVLLIGQEETGSTVTVRPALSDVTDDAIPDDPLLDDPLPDELFPEEVVGDVVPAGDVIDKSASSEHDRQTDEIDLPVLGRVRLAEWGMPAFTFAVGLVDGFNPCAMWVLVFLLSVLVSIRDRRKILLIAGTFVTISGLAYFAFMAAWFNVFEWIGLLRPVQIGLALAAIAVGTINVKDFFAFRQGVTLSIPESAKPAIYRRVRRIVTAKSLWLALGGAIALAIVVNFIELLCTAGLPALYTEILAVQQYPAWLDYLYLGLYIVAYMLDDTLLVASVVVALSKRKLQESHGRWLKLLSGTVILALGLLMLVRPEWLT
ncbi:MAG: glutaredoxin domain-containing protein [Pirellulaceae bacterium]|nr:hypothetical protein [Planctomycetales bacterium]